MLKKAASSSSSGTHKGHKKSWESRHKKRHTDFRPCFRKTSVKVKEEWSWPHGHTKEMGNSTQFKAPKTSQVCLNLRRCHARVATTQNQESKTLETVFIRGDSHVLSSQKIL